jgi:hypothetical protein
LAANNFTLVRATPHQLIYSYDNQAGPGTLPIATLLADAVTGPLKTALTSSSGECNSDAKANAALITGAPFVGAITASVTTNIQSTVQPLAFTAGKAPPCLTAVDSGGGNDPLLTLTSDTASQTGNIFITHRWSPTV